MDIKCLLMFIIFLFLWLWICYTVINTQFLIFICSIYVSTMIKYGFWFWLISLVHKLWSWYFWLWQEAVAQGFEIEIERFGTPECYFKSLPAELEVKRDNIVKILEDAGLYPIIPEGGYFILADVTPISKS